MNFINVYEQITLIRFNDCVFELNLWLFEQILKILLKILNAFKKFW